MLNPSQLPVHLLSRDKKLNSAIQRQHLLKQTTAQRNKLSQLLHNFQPGYLEPQFQGDQTLKVKQQQILQAVNIQTAANAFQLELDMGQYQCGYSRNGRTLMLTSSQGHVALMDWREKELLLELNLRQQISAGTFMHNDQMFALSQPSNTFVYDNRGIELHRLPRSNYLQYLPYHFLLVLSDNRKLKYYDTTTGHIVADHIAKNQYTALTQNHSNAVIAAGTSKGVVEWWTPGVGTPGVQVFVGSKVEGIAFHKGYMYTLTDRVKVWDSRMLKLVTEQILPRRAQGITVSESGLLAVNYGFKVEFFKDTHVQKQKMPYLRHNSSGKHNVNNMAFVPFQDAIGMGTSKGFSSVVVPGAGVPYFDSFENNPFETKKQKREALVHKLLEKLPAETITIDPNVLGGMSRLSKEQMEAEEKAEEERKRREHMEKVLAKKKTKGKNKISKKLNRKDIELDKIRREQLTKVVNSRLWAKRAERNKRASEMSLIERMQSEGLGVADLMKGKVIEKEQDEEYDE